MSLWKIFNVSTPQKGTRLNEEFSKPLIRDDPRFSFLQRIVFWIDAWEVTTRTNKASLSRQTFTSLRHSCLTLPLIINHLTINCGFSYVLTTFLQNDPLEHHFGLYRQMSGANYHISYCQILESERRLKVSSILKLYQSSTEQISIHEFISKFSECPDSEPSPPDVSSQVIEELHNQLPLLETIEYDSQTLQALAFMAGYTVHQYYKRSAKCSACLNFLTIDKELLMEQPQDSRYAYLKIVDRGSLKWPSDVILDSVVILWKIFVSIDNNKSLLLVLAQGSSKQILVSLGIKYIEGEYSETWRNTCSSCSTVYWDILRQLFSVMANCLISNKIKNYNSQLAARGDSRKAKKFSHH